MVVRSTEIILELININHLSIIENLSLYMDRSEFSDDDVNDGRISDVLRCIAWLS